MSHGPSVWHDIFSLQLTVGENVLRSLLVYLFLIVLLRLVGKRELGQATASISLSELRAIARRQGFPGLAEVHTAILETNGVVTMFKEDEPGHYHPSEPGGLRIGKRRRTRR